MSCERRRAPRRAPDASEPLARFRLRVGRELAVVDVASGGALVEGEGRLLPGTHVDVHVVTTEGRLLVRSRVLRAWVYRLWSDRILYRSAIAFQRHVDVSSGYPVPNMLPESGVTPGTSYPAESV